MADQEQVPLPPPKHYHLEGWAPFFRPEEDRMRDEEWKRKGKCRNSPQLLERFVPDTKDSDVNSRAVTKEMKKLCLGGGSKNMGDNGLRCPVVAECLEYALENRVWEGVFGGTSGRERRKLATARNKQTPSGGSSKKTSSSSPSSGKPSSNSKQSGKSSATPTTSTPAKSARRTGAPELLGTPSPASPRRSRSKTAATSPSTPKAETSTSASKRASNVSVSSSVSGTAKSAARSGGQRARTAARSATPSSSSTSKSQSKTKASASSVAATGSSKARRKALSSLK